MRKLRGAVLDVSIIMDALPGKQIYGFVRIGFAQLPGK